MSSCVSTSPTTAPVRRLGRPAGAADRPGGARGARSAGAGRGSRSRSRGAPTRASTPGARSRASSCRARAARALARGAATALTPSDIAVLAAAPAADGFDARRDATFAHLLLPALASPARARSSAGARCSGPTARAGGCSSLRRGGRRHARLHRLHPDPDRARPLPARMPAREWRRGRCSARPPQRLGRRRRVFEFWIEADAFMRNMVRVLVGTMLEVGRAAGASRSSRRCWAARPRATAGDTAPPHGLYLASVATAPDRRRPNRARPPTLRIEGMRVLLTNDDGIGAKGLQALRRALVELPERRGQRDRARLQPQRDRAQHHDALAALGRGGRLRGRHDAASPPTARRSTASASPTSA